MESLESWKKEVEVKFDQFLSHSKAQAVAMEELRTMFKTIAGKEKLLDEGSPSMTESALENQQQQASKPRKGVGKEKLPVVSATGRKEGGRTTRKLASEDISVSNDDLPFVTDPDVESLAEVAERCVSELDTSRSVLNVVQEAQERIRQGPSDADVADPTMDVPGSQHPSHDPLTSTNEADITKCPTAVQDIPSSQNEENVPVEAAEGVVKTPKTPDSGGHSGDSNSEDGGPAAQEELNSEVSTGKDLDSQASAQPAPQKPAETLPAAGSPMQRRSMRPPRSPQQVIPRPSSAWTAPLTSNDCRMLLSLMPVQVKVQKKEPKPKATSAAEKKASVPSTKQVACCSTLAECLIRA